MDGLEIVMQGQIREIYQDGYNGEIYGRKNLKDSWQDGCKGGIMNKVETRKTPVRMYEKVG